MQLDKMKYAFYKSIRLLLFGIYGSGTMHIHNMCGHVDHVCAGICIE